MRKATGIIRRVNDLGRVVIPKKLRRTLRIREGDPLEIYVDTTEGTIMLNKYSPVLSVAEIADDYANSIYESTGLSILVGDRDYVVVVAGARKKDYMNRTLSDLQATEVPVVFEEIKTYSTVDADGWIWAVFTEKEAKVSEATIRLLLKTAANFMAKQLGSDVQ